MAQSRSLPPIQTLFVDSWRLFLAKLLNLFLFALVSVAIAFAAILIAFLILAVFGVGLNLGRLTSAPMVFSSLGLVSVLVAIPMITLVLILQIATILLVADRKKDFQLKLWLKTGWRRVLPYFLASLVVLVLTLGGLWLLVIPGIVIAFLFSFYRYELILEDKSSLQALRSSVGLVADHFWGILGRALVLGVLSFVISFALGRMIALRLIFSIIIGWYSLCYSYVLYQQAKAATDGERAGSLKWILIISAIGWVLSIFLFSAVVNFVSHLPKPQGYTPYSKTLPSPSEASNSGTF